MQENSDFFAIFSLEDARVASYSLRAPHNTSIFGDPAEVRGKNICQTTGKGKTGGGERYQQHKQHKPTTIARATTQHALEGFTCGRNRKAILVAGNNVSECDSRGREKYVKSDTLLCAALNVYITE